MMELVQLDKGLAQVVDAVLAAAERDEERRRYTAKDLPDVETCGSVADKAREAALRQDSGQVGDAAKMVNVKQKL